MRSWRWKQGSESLGRRAQHAAARMTTIRRRVRITRAERQTVVVLEGVLRAPCACCGRDVRAVTWDEAARLLGVPIEDVRELAAANRIHAIVAISGMSWICRDSLFASS